MSEQNQAVEMHDSEVLGVERLGDTVLLSLDVYIHRSDGRPGQDAGTGWGQKASLSVAQASIVAEPPGGYLWITDGSIQVGEQCFDDVLPLPFEHTGPVLLRFEGAEGCLQVAGRGVNLVLLGEAHFIEQVP